MTIINTNSISGINSITAQGASGVAFYDSSGNFVQSVPGAGGGVAIGTAIAGAANLAIVDPGTASFSIGQNVDGTGANHLGIYYGGNPAGSAIFTSNGDISLWVDGAGPPTSQIRFGRSFGADTWMTMTSAGRIGIGITNPEKNLEVSSSSSPTIRINNSDGSISAGQTIGAIEFKSNDGSGIPISGDQVTGSIESISQAAFSGQGSPSHLIFKTNGVSGLNALNERLRITHDGNVGIGTDNPTKALHLTQNSDCAIRIDANNSNANARAWEIVVGGNASNNAEMVLRTRQDDGTGGSECARFTRSGSIKLPSGGGIDFHNYGAGTNIDSNLLDDYEEGTWSPTFGASTSAPTCTYSPTPVGNYTKIGRLVHVSCKIDATGRSGGSGAWLIAGLPFTINDTTGAGGSPSMSNMNVTDGGVNIATEYQNGSTSFYAGLVTRDNASWSNLSISAVPNGNCNYRVEFSYYTDS